MAIIHRHSSAYHLGQRVAVSAAPAVRQALGLVAGAPITTVETLIAAMDEAGVAKAAVVHSSTTYGYDNSYRRRRLRQVSGSFGRRWARSTCCSPTRRRQSASGCERGLAGLRLFTGGSTKDFDPSELDDPRSFPSWELCGEPACRCASRRDPSGLPQVTVLAKRFPKVQIILDHLGRPDVTDGAAHTRPRRACSSWRRSRTSILKLTPRIFGDAKTGSDAGNVLPMLVETFGSNRMAWGSNFPTSEGTLVANLDKAKAGLAVAFR